MAYTGVMKTLVLAALILLAPALRSGGFTSASQTCPSSGNKKVASSTTKAVWYIIQAPSANTGKVYVGGSTVTTSTGAYLSAGDSLSAPPQGGAAAYDLSNTYIACTQAADTITYFYAQ